MQKICFGDPAWRKKLTQAYTFRFTETPDFTQCTDHIATKANPAHKEGFDNISLLSKETFTAGAKAKLRCAFDGRGCPEIILVEKPELCPDGAVRYGACFEIVLYQGGVNIWRHYMDEATHKCSWHKRIGLEMPVSEGEIHELEAEVIENYIIFAVNGVRLRVRTEDLPEKFHLGVTACEGIVRLYDFEFGQ